MRRQPLLNALKPQANSSRRSQPPSQPHSRGFSVLRASNPCQNSTTTSSPLPFHCMLAARLRSPSLPSSAMASAYSVHHGAANGSSFTVTALNRWSVANKQLPAVDKIKSLHVYDFDNTLFKTPLPNPSLWNGPTIGTLSSQDVFVNGGWWHDSRILAATGEGAEQEEQRGWDGWWNEKIVELVRLSIKQKDALCILLTGRSERGFAELIKKMAAAKDLDFDMVGLKPQVSPTNQRFQSTMHFKQLFLEALMETYKNAEDIRVYEDRPKHTKGFRDFFAEYNRRQNIMPTRGPLTAEVVQVADTSTTLDPVVEVAEVQHMINMHNEVVSKQPYQTRQNKLRIKKTVFFTGYMLTPEDTKKLITLAKIPTNFPQNELKYHANNILICPRPCPGSILEKVGGMGSKMSWEVTGTACFENSIWAACLRPVPSTAKFHTDNPSPLVVLALRKGARPIDAGKIQNWQPIPPEKAFQFETVVGEKVILRIEAEDPREDEYESLFANKTSKRKHAGDDDYTPRSSHGHYAGRNESRGYHTGGRGQGRGRGNANRGYRGASRGGGRSGRGRGGGFNYRSLDDVEPKNQQGGYGPQVDYDDTHHQPPTQPAAHANQSNPQSQYGYNSQPPRGPGGPQGRPMGGQGANGADLQNYY
ncbi:Fc.00g013820.m01.CDS01 [Cosmosporella sp. VM-42]